MVEKVPESLDELLKKGSIDVMCWEDDDLAIRMAAGNARLPYNNLNAKERKHFSDVITNKKLTTVYLHIRNKMLQAWNLEPNVELTLEMAYHHIYPSFSNFRKLIRRIYGYLVRNAHINYGSFFSLRTPPELLNKKRIIVVGAGAAGIAAARQLRFFGFDVIILEGRDRVGGRLHTYKVKRPNTDDVLGSVDLGAAIVTGIHGNPIVTLMRQILSEPVRLNSACPIYDDSGKLINHRRDHLVEQAFRDVGETLSYIVHAEKLTSMKKENPTTGEEEEHEPLSLEKGYEIVMEQMELQNQRRRLKFWESYENLLGKIKTVTEEVSAYAKSVQKVVDNIEKMETMKEEIENKFEADILHRFNYYELNEALFRLERAKERRLGLVTTLKDLKKKEPSSVYMNEKDRKLLDFHYANLEYANGTTMENISAENWDQDDMYQMAGSHMTIREGYGTFLARMAASNKGGPSIITPEVLKTGCTVTDITYDQKGVKVNYFTGGDQRNSQEIGADAVLVTVPLGILKRPDLRFHPQLPQTKLDAIQQLGYGNLNKVILFFEKAFWNTEQHFFGHVNPSKLSRGEFFLFMSVDNAPILVALLAGHASYADQPNHVITRNAMAVLQSIFGSSIPKMPIEAVITRWHEDQFSYGSYSYIPPGVSADIYDILAEPVRAQLTDGAYEGPERIYFAGEHTYRRAPATVPGAWLSGMAAATAVADNFLGTPFSAETATEEAVDVVDLASDSDSEVDTEEPLLLDPKQNKRPQLRHPAVSRGAQPRQHAVGGGAQPRQSTVGGGAQPRQLTVGGGAQPRQLTVGGGVQPRRAQAADMEEIVIIDESDDDIQLLS